MRGWRSSGTPRASCGGPKTSPRSRRSAFAARRCRASRRCRTSRCGPAPAASRAAPRSASTPAPSPSMTEAGMPEGTRIDVEEVFYNLPARRKFLKSDQAESAHVSRTVTQLALGAPAVGFTLISAGRRLLECPPVAGLAERLYQLYGEPDDLVRVDKEAAGVRITGYVAGARGERAAARARRTSSSTAAWCATRRSRTPSSTPTAWRRSRNAAPRCTCSSRCRSTRWT